jgi:Met-zincin/Domain of unknown function (DUF5117)
MSFLRFPSRALFAVVLSLAVVAVQAQTDPQVDQRRGSARGAGAAGPGDGGQAPPGPRQQAEDTRPLEEVVKDYTKIPGLVTLYREKKGTTDNIYMEVPQSMLGKLMLLQVTSGSGLGDTPNPMVFHGMPLDDIPLKLRLVDDNRIDIMRPNLDHRSGVPEVKRMIERSFPDEVLGSFDIRTRSADHKTYLIEIGSFLRGDVAELSNTLGTGGYALDPAHTYVDAVKNFPENTVVHTVLSLTRRGPAQGGPAPKTVPWMISYNLSEIPVNDGYKPRLGDPRIGYFTQSYQTLDDQASRDQTVNFIERWDVEKADPTAKLSPPKKPIVFYIDNAVPREYRDDVRRGLLMWNPAFEKIGIKDAIVVKQMPDDADWDIADLRYNVVRWTTGMPFSIALMRANPLTGEILNACINFDGVFASSANGEFDEVVNPSNLFEPAPPPLLPGKLNDLLCDMQESSARIGAEGENLFESLATPDLPFDRDAYIHQRLAEVVCHEMGHCLGLRHNFIASTQLSLSQLANPDYVKEHGTSASVMDYVPYNVAAIKHRGVDYYQATVGDYDRWAIEYGYTHVDSDTPNGERKVLNEIASQDGAPGHRYLSDYTADDYDPADVRYDFSAQPLDWAAKLMNVSQYLLDTAGQRRIKTGQSYYAFTRSWTGALNTYIRAASYVPRYIGGVNLSNSFSGDKNGGEPIHPVDAVEQRRALSLLDQYVFGETALHMRKDDLAKLTFNPNVRSNEANGQARLFPIRSTISSFQAGALHRVFAPDVLTRISNNEFRSSDTLTLAQLFHEVSKSIWSELGTGHEVTDLRRQLQREHLAILTELAVHKDPGAPDDARALALANLSGIKSQLEAGRLSAKGPYGKAHYGDCLAVIDQALNAKMDVTEPAPAPPTFRRGG